jgi:hypothetical protein
MHDRPETRTKHGKRKEAGEVEKEWGRATVKAAMDMSKEDQFREIVGIPKPRLTSNYHVECICGEKLVSPLTRLICGSCGREIEIEWPAREIENVEPKTISAKYERLP